MLNLQTEITHTNVTITLAGSPGCAHPGADAAGQHVSIALVSGNGWMSPGAITG